MYYTYVYTHTRRKQDNSDYNVLPNITLKFKYTQQLHGHKSENNFENQIIIT